MMTEMTYTFCEDTVSDLHKDAYGMRPSEGFWQRWREATDVEKQIEWDRLCQVLERRLEENEEEKQECIAQLENRIASLIELGARNRNMALRWLMQAYECNGDWEYLEWNLGVPYDYTREDRV